MNNNLGTLRIEYRGYRSLGSSNHRCWMTWDPVEQESRQPLLQQHRCSCQQVAHGLPLFLTSVPGQRRPQLPQLLQPHLVPAAERLCHHWDEGNALLVALISCNLIFSLYATVRAWPGSMAARALVPDLRGWVTITSNAASLPPAHPGMKMSAGDDL